MLRQRKSTIRCFSPCLQSFNAVLAIILVAFAIACVGVGASMTVSYYRELLPSSLMIGLIISGTLAFCAGMLGLLGSACFARRIGLLVFYLCMLILLLVAATVITLVLWLGADYVSDVVTTLVMVTLEVTGCGNGTVIIAPAADSSFSGCLTDAAQAILFGVNATSQENLCVCIDDILAYVPTALSAAKLVSLALIIILVFAAIVTSSLINASKKAQPRRPPGESDARKRAKSENSENLLRRGLQLKEGQVSAEEEITGIANPGADGDASRSDTGWLIGELKRRILDAGLAVKVLKLVPGGRDDLPDVEGEREVDSGHEVTMLVIGYYDGGIRQRRRAQATVEHEGSFDAERLCAEAERLSLKLRCKESFAVRKGGRAAYARFTAAQREAFEPFPSVLRQQLLRVILEAKASDPSSPTNGAGLDLTQLHASGRLLQTLWLHQDDETDVLVEMQLKGRGGCLPKPLSGLRKLYDYLGSELTYYFAWAAYYTRLLWLPAVVGIIFWAVDELYFENLAYPEVELIAGLDRFYNNASFGGFYVSSGPVDSLDNLSKTELEDLKSLVFSEPASGDAVYYGRARYATICAFAMALLVWGSVFLEGWKRRAKILALDWGALDNALATVAKEHVKFTEDALKKGFYTPDGLWVDLDDGNNTVPGPSHDSGPIALPKKRRAWIPSREDAALLEHTPSTRWSSPYRLLRRLFTSVVIMLFMGLTCILTILAIMVLRLVLAARAPDYKWAASVVNALAIEIFNMLWRHIALALNTWENHRLEKQFRDALVYKMFGFQFINCYFTFFYLAFFRRHVGAIFGFDDSCGGGFECMVLLRTQLQVSLIINFVMGTFVEISRPLLKIAVRKLASCINNLRKRKKSSTSVTPGTETDPEREKRQRREINEKVRKRQPLTEAERAKYDEDELVYEVCAQLERPELKSVEKGLPPSFYEFNELAIQFGYIIMFSAAWPAAAAMALLNNLIEVRLDSVKVLKITRRVPASAQGKGIGAWRQVLGFLVYLGLATNLLIIAYTTDMFSRYYPEISALEVLVIVVVLEHALIVLKMTIDYIIPDVPASVRVEMAREEWLADRRIHAQLEHASLGYLAGSNTQAALGSSKGGWKPISTRPSATAVLAPAPAPSTNYVPLAPLAPVSPNAPHVTKQMPYARR